MLLNLAYLKGFGKGIYFFVLAFLFIYGLEIVFLPLNTSKIVIFILLFHVFLSRPKILKFFGIRILSILLIVALFYSVTTSVLGIYDFTLSYNLVLCFFEYYVGSILLVSVMCSHLPTMKVITIFFSVFLVQSLFVFLSFIDYSFVAFTLDYLPEGGHINYEDAFRVRGLSNTGGASLSANLMMGLFFGMLIFRKTSKFTRQFLISVCFVLILAATLFVGRTGLYLSFVILAGFFILYGKKTIPGIVLICVITFSIGAVESFLSDENVRKLTTLVLPRAAEILYVGKEQTTLDVLQNMIILPTSPKEIIFGAGGYVGANGGNFVSSDIGYIRILFAVGIFGFCLYYLVHILFFRKICKSLKSKDLIALFTLLFIVMLILEAKEPFFLKPLTMRPYFVFSVLSILACSVSSKKSLPRVQ